MSDNRRIRLLTGLIFALVALNIGLLSWLWLRPDHSERRRTRLGAGTFLADTLRFSPEQRQQLRSFQKLYFDQMKARQQSIRQGRRAYFHLLDSSFTESQRRELAVAFHRQAVETDLLTLAHFDRVAGICTPDQRRVLNKLLSELPSRAFRTPGLGGRTRTLRSGRE